MALSETFTKSPVSHRGDGGSRVESLARFSRHIIRRGNKRCLLVKVLATKSLRFRKLFHL